MLGNRDLNLSRYKAWSDLLTDIRRIQEMTHGELEDLVTRMRTGHALAPAYHQEGDEYFTMSHENNVGDLMWYYAFLTWCQIMYKSLANLVELLGNLELEEESNQ